MSAITLVDQPRASDQAWRKELGEAKVVAVMGMTGSGKSTFIQTLTGSQEVIVGDGLQSCTQKPKLVPFKHGGQTIILIDTPGFDDTFRTDADVLQDVAEVLTLTYAHNAKLSGIIYLHRIIDPRITHGGMRNLQMFRKLCGSDPMKNVILATTFWDQVREDQARKRLDELESTPHFWKDMIEEGARVGRYDNNFDSGLLLVMEAIGRGKVELQIQHEMVREQKPLSETAAGIALNDELLELTQRHAAEIKQLKEEMAKAQREQDFKLAIQLQKATERSQKDIDTLKIQQQRLSEDRRNELRALEQTFALQLRKMELEKEKEADEKVAAIIQKIKEENRPSVTIDSTSSSSTTKPASTKLKRDKTIKVLKFGFAGVGAAASIAGAVMNPMMIPSAIHAFVKLANLVFSSDTDPGADPPSADGGDS